MWPNFLYLVSDLLELNCSELGLEKMFNYSHKRGNSGLCISWISLKISSLQYLYLFQHVFAQTTEKSASVSQLQGPNDYRSHLVRGTATYSEDNYMFIVNINLHLIFPNAQTAISTVTWLPQSTLHSHQPSSNGEDKYRRRIYICQIKHKEGKVRRDVEHPLWGIYEDSGIYAIDTGTKWTSQMSIYKRKRQLDLPRSFVLVLLLLQPRGRVKFVPLLLAFPYSALEAQPRVWIIITWSFERIWKMTNGLSMLR